ncbi:MAG TPA: hypothetical protein VJJ81_02875 [Candidatus Babeliales bacterium]|nr:hypothetical protein [Candidatus Babeliales bacterium]
MEMLTGKLDYKSKSLIISIVVLNLNLNLLADDNNQKYVVHGWESCFFSNFIGVLNHLLWADRNGKIPVVYWGENFLYYEPTAPSQNAWQYYFEPVSKLDYNFSEDKFDNLVGGVPQYWVKDGYQLTHNNQSAYQQGLRDACHDIIDKYIKVRNHIKTKVDSFYDMHMKSVITIGIHLRGSDKYTEVGHIDVYKIINQANELANSLGDNVQFFVATDEIRLLNLAKKHLNRPMINRESTKIENLHTNLSIVQYMLADEKGNLNKLLLGEEVLIDTLLLSKCNTLICTPSLVSQGAAYFNNKIPCYVITENGRQNSWIIDIYLKCLKIVLECTYV